MKAIEFFSEKAPKWLIYSIYGMFLLTLINTCNISSLSSSLKKANKNNLVLQTQIDSLNSIVAGLPAKLQYNDDMQTAKFLYWERQADAPSYATYTIKDYYTAIEK